MSKKIKEEIDNIRSSCDEIEEEIKPKRASTRGDPVVRLND